MNDSEEKDIAMNEKSFLDPEMTITVFTDDLILADSNRCCDDHANFVGYT